MEFKWKHQVPTIYWCICYFMKPCCIWISQSRLKILLLSISVKDIGTVLSPHTWFLWAVLVSTKTVTPPQQLPWSKNYDLNSFPEFGQIVVLKATVSYTKKVFLFPAKIISRKRTENVQFLLERWLRRTWLSPCKWTAFHRNTTFW